MACLFLFSPKRVALAQDTIISDDDVNRIASQLYCPVCENVPLDECPTAACQQWRDLIRQRLAEGWTDQEIKDYFVAQYGDRVLGEPPRQGLNWLLYLLPPIGILAGLALMLARLKHPPEDKSARNLNGDDPYREQVDRDLKNLEQ